MWAREQSYLLVIVACCASESSRLTLYHFFGSNKIYSLVYNQFVALDNSYWTNQVVNKLATAQVYLPMVHSQKIAVFPAQKDWGWLKISKKWPWIYPSLEPIWHHLTSLQAQSRYPCQTVGLTPSWRSGSRWQGETHEMVINIQRWLMGIPDLIIGYNR